MYLNIEGIYFLAFLEAERPTFSKDGRTLKVDCLVRVMEGWMVAIRRNLYEFLCILLSFTVASIFYKLQGQAIY